MAAIPLGHRAEGENYYLRLMAEEIEKGYTPGSTFRPESQLCVNKKFRIIFGPIFSDRYLKSRFKNLRKRHKEFSELLNQPGIEWNMNLNTVCGNDELLKENYKHRYKHGVYVGEPNFELMCQVFESGVNFE